MKQKSLSIPSIPHLDDMPDDCLEAKLREQGAVVEINTVNWTSAFPKAPASGAYLAHSETALYALFYISNDELRAAAAADLGPVADDTCFELFIRPEYDLHYCNCEFNYRGIANISRRTGRSDAVKFTPDKLSRVRRIPLMPASAPHDNRAHDPNKAVKLIVSLPLDLLGVDLPAHFPVRMMGNLYSCSAAAATPYYLSWAAIDTEMPDFHRPEFFRPITLV